MNLIIIVFAPTEYNPFYQRNSLHITFLWKEGQISFRTAVKLLLPFFSSRARKQKDTFMT